MVVGRLWRRDCGLAKETVSPIPLDIRSSSPFSNERTSAHYNPKGKIYVCFVGNAYKCVYMCFHAGRRGDESEGMAGRFTG